MTEKIKIAKLWSNFHRLPDEHKDLIIKIAGSMTEPGNPTVDKVPVKSLPDVKNSRIFTMARRKK